MTESPVSYATISVELLEPLYNRDSNGGLGVSSSCLAVTQGPFDARHRKGDSHV